ncbi:uncharacterized protein LOC110651312 [Hevea brasiliensis]|uniref:uncharacterized protein LOC110651312 n=1 Tax=Hevea brasiliensis TaxID=3981 RepID=UPI0025E23A08|nr:uncharacterized protein LOC110651312 [Hevea brasiliensis]
MLLDRTKKMGSHFFHEFKRQASLFFKEKIKTARLALTDVTPAELLTKFDRKTWRVTYKTLLVLEHLLTHGPLRVADEFPCDKEVIKKLESFQLVDEKGFNWGSCVRNLSARILKLLESEPFLKEERARLRKLTQRIQGFGSFPQRSLSHDENFKDLGHWTCKRSKSNYSDENNQEYKLLASDDYFLMEERIHKPEKIYDDISPELDDSGKIRGGICNGIRSSILLH